MLILKSLILYSEICITYICILPNYVRHKYIVSTCLALVTCSSSHWKNYNNYIFKVDMFIAEVKNICIFPIA